MPCALPIRSEEHTSELQSPCNLVCRLLLEKKINNRRLNCNNITSITYSQWPTQRLTTPLRLSIEQHTQSAPSYRSAFCCFFFFFFNDTATTEIYTLSLHDALPIYLVDGISTTSSAQGRGNSFN